MFDKSIPYSSGKEIQVYKLNNELLSDSILNSWVSGLRNNSVEESLLEPLIKGTGLIKQEFLEKNIFPSHQNSLGASTMSGEFGEILVYDYINFTLKHYVTRTRYLEKVNPNMPVSGSDVIGYQVKNIDKPSKTDHLIVAEVKTRSSKSGNKKSLCEKTVKYSIINLAIGLLSLGYFTDSMSTGVIWTLATDVVPKSMVAFLGSIQNFGGFVGAALSPVVTGAVLQATGHFE